MAAPLSQDEVDALLSQDAVSGDTTENEEISVQESHDATKTKSKTRHFSIPESKPYRFKFGYRSPVIRSQECVFDPDPVKEFEPGMVVVRSLSNYAEFRKKNPA